MGKREAVVIGWNYSCLLSMARSVGKAGCDVHLIKHVTRYESPAQKISSPERYCRYVRRCHQVLKGDMRAITDLLLEHYAGREKRVLLIPTDDYSAAALEMDRERLAPHFDFPHSDAYSLLDLMDKSLQKQLAREAGFAVSEEWITQTQNGAYSLPDKIAYPCFTKSRMSVFGHKSNMARCENEAQLIRKLDQIAAKRDCPLLIEKYHRIEREFAVVGLCDHGRVIMPGVIEMISGGFDSRAGVTIEGRLLPMSRFPGLEEKLTRLMQRLDYVGLFDVDLYEAEGTIYFTEINLRFGASGYIFSRFGINLPAMLVNVYEQDDRKDAGKRLEGEHLFLSEMEALKALSQGYITAKRYRELKRRYPNRFIHDETDRLAGLVFMIRETKWQLIRTLRPAQGRASD